MTKPGDPVTSKKDPRHPDTDADKKPGTPASPQGPVEHPTDLDPGASDEGLSERYGFSTIDTKGVDHSAGEVGEPVPVESVTAPGPEVKGGNSTFASRRAEREKRENTRVKPDQVTSK